MEYTLDTNIFIDGFRSEEAQAEVFAFLKRALPFTYLGVVVMQQLAAGARTTEVGREVQQGRMTVQFRREAINAMNHVILVNLNTKPTSAAFGTISDEKSTGRAIQLGLKFLF